MHTKFAVLSLTLLTSSSLVACDTDTNADFAQFVEQDSHALTDSTAAIGLLPPPAEPSEARATATHAGGDGIEAQAGPEVHTESSVDLSIYKELNHYYYLHLDYYNFYQRIILSYGCSQSEVVFWWEGASQGYTGHVNVQRFIDRLDTIANANDVSSSYSSYAASLSSFFQSIQGALDNCTGY